MSSQDQESIAGGAAEDRGEIPLAAAREPGPVGSAVAPPAVAPPVEARRKKAARPAEAPLWPVPEEAGGRRWIVVMVFIAIIGLYAWGLTRFYAGAQGGVDQAGYLMTARLMAGDKNVYTAAGPAPATMPAFAAAPATQPGVAAHPHPTGIQSWAGFNWIRNRLSFVPETPFQFASRMCIYTEPFGPASPTEPAQYRVYAKYPPGYPALAAIGRMFFGIDGMYFVNPLCTILACYFAYFLFRQAVSPFMSLIGVIWLACNPLVWFYANDANSHSSTLLFIVAGFWGLLSWMRTRQQWRAWIGGLALGYACTIRYTEFLMVLPVLFAALVNFRWDKKRVMGSIALVAGWAIPVAILAGICWVSFGAPWKTGYSYCKESTGFAWKYLTGDPAVPRHAVGNWDTLVTQLNTMGLFVLWPFALAGLFAMMGSAWRLGMVVGLWVLPQTILYMLYYWAPGGDMQIGYLRFFMTMMPGFILAGLWVLERGLVHLKGEKKAALIGVTAFGLLVLVAAALYMDSEPLHGGMGFVTQVFTAVWHLFSTSWTGFLGTIFLLGLIAGIWVVDHAHAVTKVGMALGAGVITALGCGVNLYNIMPRVEQTYTQCVDLRATVDNVRQLLPKGAALFSDDALLNQLDCVGDWKLVNSQMFTQTAFQDAKRRLESLDPEKDAEEDPNPIQPERLRFTMELLGEQNSAGAWIAKPTKELVNYENEVIDQNFAQGRRVAFLTMEREARPSRFGRVVIPERKDCDIKVLGRWVNEPPVLPPAPVQMGRMGRGRRIPAAPRRLPVTYMVLYELVKKPAPVAAPAVPKIVKPKNPETPPVKQKTIFD